MERVDINRIIQRVSIKVNILIQLHLPQWCKIQIFHHYQPFQRFKINSILMHYHQLITHKSSPRKLWLYCSFICFSSSFVDVKLKYDTVMIRNMVRLTSKYFNMEPYQCHRVWYQMIRLQWLIKQDVNGNHYAQLIKDKPEPFGHGKEFRWLVTLRKFFLGWFFCSS